MFIALAVLTGCSTSGCLDGQEGCRVQAPCQDLAFTCDQAVPAEVSQTVSGGIALEGNQVLQSPGDWVLRNGQVYAVISALEHPHFLAPTGGNLIDLSTVAPGGELRQDDSLRNLYQVGGLLPTEAAKYERIEGFMDGDAAVVQVVGTYDDDPDVRIATRYELRPCDVGIRIRTEVLNGHDEPESIFLADTIYVGGRESLAFAPGRGLGLSHPTFGLASLLDGIVEVPWVAAGAHEEPGSAQVLLSCDPDESDVSGLLSEEVVAVGKAPQLLAAGDYLVYDRFLGVGTGGSIAAASDIALDIRAQLFDEPNTLVTGVVTKPGDQGPGFRGGRPQILVYEGDVTVEDAEDPELIPWTHVEPALDGAFRFRVPRGSTYTLQIQRFGRPWGRTTVVADGDTAEVEIAMDPPGRIEVDLTVDGEVDPGLVIVYPADSVTHEAVRAKYLQHFESCAPLLGHPYGAAPSCNRILVDGPERFEIPPGTYDFYAAAGPFSTLATARGVVVPPVTESILPTPVVLEVRTLDLLNASQRTADFHVHGSASFDSSIPDSDRVRAFVASQVDVIVATDHDKVHDYAQAMDAAQAHQRLTLLVGLETTGHILQPLLEGSLFPKVVGHWIVWPIPYDPEGPWRGAPWDEKALPGELFTRFEDQGWPSDSGVIQLNHPWGGVQFGRDFGWATALELDLHQPLEGPGVPEGHELFFATPEGSRFSNADYHAQEVMNGTDNLQFLQYRAIWHYLLNQGVPRAGTANSDSHTLGGNVLGFPVNVVEGPTGVFEQSAFNAAVRAGHMYGTNGPALDVRIEDGGTVSRPAVDAVIAGTGQLRVDVRAANWVPLREGRIYVDGVLVEQFALEPQVDSDDTHAARFERDLATLVTGPGDHWLNVEVGDPLPAFADFNCDGVPDTDDNNGDGQVDASDIEVDEGEPRPEPDEAGCFSVVGPLDGVLDPEALPVSDYDAVVPRGAPLAFSNPFLIDGDGDGAFTGVSP